MRKKGFLEEGEDVILIDRKERMYLITLKLGQITDLRGGFIPHSSLIGKREGSIVTSSRGEKFFVFRPTLPQFILKMPRKGQIIYPKDISLILFLGDIFPGAVVVEGGIGSGALTLSLLEKVGEKGKVISYEIREDFALQAKENIKRFLGEKKNFFLKLKDIYKGIEEKKVDRIILDLPEPWKVVKSAGEALLPGGIFLSYLPTIIQVREFVENLRETALFTGIEVIESLLRPWNVEGLSVRPCHRMVAHTGFIVLTRKRR